MFIELIKYVYSKSDIQILIIFVLASCTYSVIIYYFLSATIGRLHLPHDNYFGVAIISAMTSLVAVLLTFTLVQSINAYSRASEAVLSEISSIELLHKRSLFLNNRYTDPITQNTINYVNHVIESDWHTMITGQRSELAQEAFDKLLFTVSRASHATDVDQETAWDLSTSFGEVVKARYDRLKLAGHNLPAFFYMAILFLFTIHICQFYLLTKNTYLSLIILKLHMAALGLLLGLVFIYDHPFEGGTAIKIDLYKDLAARISKIHSFE
jgi:Protein of unknown function (DUF4239)